MRVNLSPDCQLAETIFDRLREATCDGPGVTREAYGPGEARAHAIIRDAAASLALEIETDAAGNMLMTLPGQDRAAPRHVVGSHLDSVRQGGNFDGAAGVLAGLAALAGMRQADFTPQADLTLIAIRAEEAGAWFPTSYPGSRAALGVLPKEALATKRLDTGQTLAAHMREAGFDPDAVAAGACLLDRTRIASFVELHIEQGPVLDDLAIPVGIVTGIPGSRRFRQARVLGQWGHSGAVPRAWRHDAAIALAELAYRLDQEWAALEAEGHAMVCTFCVLATSPQAGFTKIAGEAGFELDMRAVDRDPLDRLVARLGALTEEIASRRGVRFELGPETGSFAVALDAGIRGALAASADELGVAHRAMPSGGGHDAAAFAQAGVPSGMLFVRNQNGSHNPDEAMRLEDFHAACAVLTRYLATVGTP